MRLTLYNQPSGAGYRAPQSPLYPLIMPDYRRRVGGATIGAIQRDINALGAALPWNRTE
jgi:hypothetical protein